MIREYLLAGVACVGLAAAGAFGQEVGGDGGDDPQQESASAEAKVDAGEVMRRADGVMRGLKTLSFEAESHGIGGMGTRAPHVKAKARLARGEAKDAFPWRFEVRGQAKKRSEPEEAPFATWFDGKDVRTALDHQKQVLEAAWGSRMDPMKEGAGWPLTWVIRWNQLVSAPFEDAESQPRCRFEGMATVYGEACDVIYVDYSETSDPTLFDAWWYISRSDSLPRRFELHFIDTGSGDSFAITEITSIRRDEPIELASLAPAMPEGYEVKRLQEPERQARRASAPKPAGPQVGDLAPDWTLKDPQGKEHTLSGYRGKVVVLDFWATWCGPCKAAMPGIQRVHERFAKGDVEIFGLNCWENGDAPGYMKEKGFTYGLLMGADDVASGYGVSGIPTIYVIGKDGKVVYRAVGFEGEEALEEAIESGLEP